MNYIIDDKILNSKYYLYWNLTLNSWGWLCPNCILDFSLSIIIFQLPPKLFYCDFGIHKALSSINPSPLSSNIRLNVSNILGTCLILINCWLWSEMCKCVKTCLWKQIDIFRDIRKDYLFLLFRSFMSHTQKNFINSVTWKKCFEFNIGIFTWIA